MNKKSVKSTLAGLVMVAGLAGWSGAANATTVQFQTVLGNFEVNLFDNITPETVANFLDYVEAEAYTDSFIHRSVPSFILQGGGFTYDAETESDNKVKAIPTNSPVVNEPHLSNKRGTIAMAKLGSNPNSATAQWFFNLSDNSSNLDHQNGGFTVFGQVVGNGMEIIDAIAALDRFNRGGAFSELPLREYGEEELEAKTPVTDAHLIMVTGILVLDADPDTGNDLNPAPTTRRASSGSTGAVLFWLLILLALGRRQR